MSKKLTFLKAPSRVMTDELKAALDQAIASGQEREFIVLHPEITIVETAVEPGQAVVRIVGAGVVVAEGKKDSTRNIA
jgi:hypothetical protein